MTVLNPERLVALAYKYPSLYDTWYLVTCACLSVVNQPQEIPKVLHFALRQQLLDSGSSLKGGLLCDKHLLRLAEDSELLAEKFADLSAVGVQLPDVLIPYTYHEKLPLAFKYSKLEDIQEKQSLVASKVREVLLKSVALAGLPKAINALMILKNVTPTKLQPSHTPVRPLYVNPGRVASNDLVQEDFAGTEFAGSDTIDGLISEDSIDRKKLQKELIRGSEFWNTIYLTKVNMRIRKQMFNAYPDLWYYAYHHGYAPLLSFTEILSAKETSMCIVASLIPQDVNPQLKGHLRGALNVGVSKQELDDLRLLVLDVCEWSGNVTWREGKALVAKL